MKDSIKIGIVAGEHSGDILGENLLKALKKIKNVEIYGVGGPKMEGQGLKSAFDFNNLNIMGLVDPILNYSKIMSYKNDLCNLFIKEKIDVFIGIDSPDFNMQIQKRLKKISKIKKGVKSSFQKTLKNNYQNKFKKTLFQKKNKTIKKI